MVTMEVQELQFPNSWTNFQQLWPDQPLQQTNVNLKTYLGDQVKAKGSVDVTVQHNNQATKLPLLIVEGAGTMLLERN